MSARFIAWPGWAHLRFAWFLSALNGAWFTFVYVSADWLTARRSLRVPIHLPIELSIPLVPSAIVIYSSIYLLFLAGPFIVRERQEFATLIRSLALTTAIGGLGFILIPSRAAFPPVGEVGIWSDLCAFADKLNLDHNMVPSLHVALSVACIAVFSRHASSFCRAALWTWAIAITVSTILTHQHHVLDAITGWAVGTLADRTTRSKESACPARGTF